MKKISTKDVFTCETYREVVKALLDCEYIYYEHIDDDSIHSISLTSYDDIDLDNLTEEDAKNLIMIADCDDMNFAEDVNYYDALPNDFRIEVVTERY